MPLKAEQAPNTDELVMDGMLAVFDGDRPLPAHITVGVHKSYYVPCIKFAAINEDDVTFLFLPERHSVDAALSLIEGYLQEHPEVCAMRYQPGDQEQLNGDRGRLNCVDWLTIRNYGGGRVEPLDGEFPCVRPGQPYRFGVYCQDEVGNTVLVGVDGEGNLVRLEASTPAEGRQLR